MTPSARCLFTPVILPIRLMARLRDIVPVIRKVGIFGFSRRLWRQMVEDSVFVWASALAYSWLFAIFPFILFLMALVPYLREDWKASFYDQTGPTLEKVLPETAYDTVWNHFLKDRLWKY